MAPTDKVEKAGAKKETSKATPTKAKKAVVRAERPRGKGQAEEKEDKAKSVLKKRPAQSLENGSEDGHESQKSARPSPAKRAKKAETPKPAHAKKAKADMVAPKRVSLEPRDDASTGHESNSAESEDDHDAMAALLKGFDSSDDDDVPDDEGFTPGQTVPRIPEPRPAARLQLAVKGGGQKQKKWSGEKDRGVIYVGRIPHGFYEKEMRAYFSQFGKVRRLRLSRNRRTGRSKHYAFLEFASQEVANIAAATMNNYLLFGHILKCKVIPNERVHPDLWKGANRKFRVLDGNKLAAKQLERPKSREDWAKTIKCEVKKRNQKAAKLKALGYDFEPPMLKGLEGPVEAITSALVEA